MIVSNLTEKISGNVIIDFKIRITTERVEGEKVSYKGYSEDYPKAGYCTAKSRVELMLMLKDLVANYIFDTMEAIKNGK